MVIVVEHDAVTTDQDIAILLEAVVLQWFLVMLARLKGWLGQNVLSLALLQLLQGGRLVSCKHTHYLVLFDTLGTDEHGTLATESFGLVFQAILTLGLHLAVSSLHIGVHCLHAVDEESRREVVHTPLREGGVFATLRAGEGLVYACLQSQAVDALLAVLVTAREHLGISVVVMADGTGDLFLQVLHTLLNCSLTLSRGNKQKRKRKAQQLQCQELLSFFSWPPPHYRHKNGGVAGVGLLQLILTSSPISIQLAWCT